MRRISKETWEQIKTAYASGIGLRELARQMNVPAGTVLARAKREAWTQQIKDAKAIALRVQSNAIGPMQSVTGGAAAVMQERGERYRERMADVSEKVVSHIASMDADSILTRGAQVEKIDTVARRTFGLDSPAAGSGALNLNVLTGGRALVQINQKNE
jgi:hypothetical protein